MTGAAKTHGNGNTASHSKEGGRDSHRAASNCRALLTPPLVLFPLNLEQEIGCFSKKLSIHPFSFGFLFWCFFFPSKAKHFPL